MIATANKLYSWSTHALTRHDVHDCLKILKQWRKGRNSEDSSMISETMAAEAAVLNFSQLRQEGVLIRVNGQAAAFSIFGRLNEETAAIHFMKADHRYKGLSEVLHHETAKNIAAAGFFLINEEEDWGLPGLRQSKLSYKPVEMRPSHTLQFKS